MTFNRSSLLTPLPDEITVTHTMAGIGMNFSTQRDEHADIEQTLLHGSILGMEKGDLRVLSILTTWMGVHYKHVNVDRLIRGVGELASMRTQAYWSAIASWLKKDRRYKRLHSFYKGPHVELLPVGNAFQISRKGEDKRFKGSILLVPATTLRDRSADVLTPKKLAEYHLVYQSRIRMGPNWRADVWAVLELESDLNIAELARRVGCSFATAWQVVQDYRILYPN